MKLLITSLFTIVFAAGLFSCSCNCGAKMQNELPKNIISKGNDYLISKVGDEFFEKFIFYDNANSKETASGYYLSYIFTMPQHDFIAEQISLHVDKSGNVNEKLPVIGIPDCIESSGDCYNVDSENAKQIAFENDLPGGIKDWKVEFEWQPEFKKYLWHITSTTQESRNADYHKANGEEMFIDPSSGDVIEKRKWNIF